MKSPLAEKNLAFKQIQFSPSSVVAIIGGGLAGCMMAHTLAKEGIKVVLYERGKNLSLAGSGNVQAVCDYRPSIYRSPYNDFMLQAFLYSNHFYKELDAFKSTGLVRLNEKEKYHLEMQIFFERFPEMGHILTAGEFKHITGLSCDYFSYFINGGGYLSPHKLCATLVRSLHIQLHFNNEIEDIFFDNGKWRINQQDIVDVVIWAGASNPLLLDDKTEYVSEYRGINLHIHPNNKTKFLNHTVTGMGHICPNDNGLQTMSESPALMDLLEIKEEAIHQVRYASRAKTYDYLPMVGPLPIREKLISKRSVSDNTPIPYHPNFYMLSGFGSHGVTTIPFAAGILKDYLLGKISAAPQSLLKHLLPQRVLIKALMTTQ